VWLSGHKRCPCIHVHSVRFILGKSGQFYHICLYFTAYVSVLFLFILCTCFGRVLVMVDFTATIRNKFSPQDLSIWFIIYLVLQTPVKVAETSAVLLPVFQRLISSVPAITTTGLVIKCVIHTVTYKMIWDSSVHKDLHCGLREHTSGTLLQNVSACLPTSLHHVRMQKTTIWKYRCLNTILWIDEQKQPKG
jgi:hypothetical protein